MKGLFKKIFQKGSEDAESSPKDSAASDLSPIASHEKSPEVEFAENFTASGGKFLFCESVDDALAGLQNIASETGLQKIFCPDENLKSLISKAGFRSFTDDCKDADVFCSNCEYLVAYNGGIMIHAKHTRGKKLKELPEVLIILAYTDQLVSRLNDALAGLRTRYTGADMPSEITTIHGPRKSGLEDPVALNEAKDIYLLYVERH